jgi:uncharacterized protein DUF6526
MEQAQSYANHKRYVAGFHFVLPAVLLLATIGAGRFLWQTVHWGNGRTLAATIALLIVAGWMEMWYIRVFPLKAQDRAIRAEEALRCYHLTGKPPDPRLRLGQLIALRFASDEEYPELARRAAEEGLRADAIKQAVRSWRADHHRA